MARSQLVNSTPLIILAFVAALATGCSCDHDAAPVVELVFPDGYSGVVRVTEDRDNGIVPEAIAGVITIDIPEDGELQLTSLRVLMSWHHLRARYRAGDRITVVRDASLVSSDDIVLWQSSYLPTGEVFYVLGTVSDWHKLEQNFRARMGFPPREGGG